MRTYQDQWVKGQLVEKGTRECASRYEIIKAFCSKYERPFTVCDIGSSMNYFGIRLCEDFPDCVVTAFEFDNFELRRTHLKKSNPDRLLFLDHKLHFNDLAILSACCHFDVVLILNVLHHVGEEFDAWLMALRQLGTNVIGEFATKGDSRSRKQAQNYRIPSDAEVLGYAQSHIKRDIQRPILLMKGNTKCS